jgi:hypothetical protein
MRSGESGLLMGVLRHHRRHHSDADAISAALVASIRRSADVDQTIGRRALTAVLPRAAVLSSTGELMVGDPISSSRSPSFRYWEDGLWNGITYGPSAVYPGGVAITNFQSGPILPDLAGLIDRGAAGFTVQYPIAALRMPDGGVACAVRPDGAQALIVYTDTNLMERAISGRCRGAAPITVENITELDEILAPLFDVDAVLLDPDPDTLAPREFLTVKQVRNRRRERDAVLDPHGQLDDRESPVPGT